MKITFIGHRKIEEDWLTSRSLDKKLAQIAAEDRAALLTEKDVEFLKTNGVETDLETLKNGVKPTKK